MHEACGRTKEIENLLKTRAKNESARVCVSERERQKNLIISERGFLQKIMYSAAEIRLIQHDARPTLDPYQIISSEI
jgi:prophage antirepressor-like protein